LLSSAAKYGGFIDRNANNLPESTGQNCTYPAGSTLGSGASTSSLEWDANQDCVPDTYFEAGEGGDLQAQINLALADILKRAASGTSVSVLSTSSTGEGSLYQAFFYPSQFEGLSEIQGLGYLQGLFVDSFGNLREDHSGPNCSGPPDGRLVLEQDCIVKIRYDSSTAEVKVDRYVDANGDGMPDSTTPLDTILLKDLQPIWEAGNRLAYTDPGDSCSSSQAGVTCRRILTWMDTNGDKFVQSAEVMEFTTANKSQLCPYLATASVLTCVSGGAAGAGQTEAANVIRFLRGEDGAGAIGGLRDRSLTIKNSDDGSSAKRVWKLGDIVDSTPVAVSTPRERYDVIYGDTSYSAFYQRYRARRTVVYVGANDGMLHAFNGGFFTANDDPSTSAVEHGYFTTTPPSGISTTRATPHLGAELWAFVPQELLPHLKWFTQTDYTHVSYVDLKPRVTDARIFTPDDDHPNGWGTVMIIGMRFGGSCAGCSSTNGGTPMTVTADFAGSGTTTTRTFYSAYVALDVTNPEKDPTIMWVFTDSTLGLSTGLPTVLRVNPSTDAPTDNTNAVWMAIFGSGPTGYTGASSQTAKFYGVNMHSGPGYAASGAFAGPIFDTKDANSFTGDLTTVDLYLTYRVNVIYGGITISTGLSNPKWAGKLYRLTTNSSTNTSLWGISGTGDTRVPTALISSYAYSGSPAPCGTSSPCRVGPIAAAPAVAMDDKGNLWVIFGTGRYWETADRTNTELQAFFGIKDTFITAGQPSQTTERNSLFNVSGIVVCSAGLGCSPTSNVSFDGGASYTTGLTLTPPGGPLNLIAQIQAVDGWVTSQPGAGERSLNLPAVIGGTVFATSFIPSPDLCSASGTGSLYALYYMSGTGYSDASLGTQTIGSTTVAVREVSLAEGMPSAPAYHLGGQGQGRAGSSSSSSSSSGGCNSRLNIFVQSSTGALNQVCGKPTLSVWSRILSWRDL
jgi:type IV pilus assembly protein PilY1